MHLPAVSRHPSATVRRSAARRVRPPLDAPLPTWSLTHSFARAEWFCHADISFTPASLASAPAAHPLGDQTGRSAYVLRLPHLPVR